jgi:hypothetical protein
MKSRLTNLAAASAVFSLLIAVDAAATPVLPGDFVGTRDADFLVGGIAASAGWDLNFVLSWDIEQLQNGDWSYRYFFENTDNGGPTTPDISHWIFEVSPTFTANDIFDDNFNVVGPDTFSPSQGNSNPGLPGDIFGVKADNVPDDTQLFTFLSTRAPMWGNFYAKGGQEFAHNTGFTLPLPTDPNADFLNWIPVPDTTNGQGQAPEPGTLLLLGTALVALSRRRRG